MSSDAFSFDQAAPAEAMDSSNIGSNESSVVQSSPNGSYSNVTSAQRSDSTKRSRPQIEDADRESRAVGRVRASPTIGQLNLRRRKDPRRKDLLGRHMRI